MKYQPKLTGIITEERCKLFFIERGYNVSVPIGDNASYDMILDVDGYLYKIQVKSCRYSSKGFINFDAVRTVSTMTKTSITRYNSDEVDYFCTWYCNMAYLIPFRDISQYTLRLEFPNHNVGGTSEIQWAKEYEADYIIGRLRNDPNFPVRDIQAEFEQYLKDAGKFKYLATSYRWMTNGTVNKRVPLSDPDPEGFYPGRCGKTNQFT